MFWVWVWWSVTPPSSLRIHHIPAPTPGGHLRWASIVTLTCACSPRVTTRMLLWSLAGLACWAGLCRPGGFHVNGPSQPYLRWSVLLQGAARDSIFGQVNVCLSRSFLY